MSGLKDDLAGVEQASAAEQVYTDEPDDYAGGEDAGEDAPRVSGQTVQSFPYYIFHFNAGKGGEAKKKKTPLARVGGFIKGGPEGTEDSPVFDDLYLKVSKTRMEDGVEVPKEAADYEDDKTAFQKKLNKIARIGKFGKAFPVDRSKDAVNAYAEQFKAADGFDCIIEIRESTDTYEGVTRSRNRIIFESMRAVDDPPTKQGLKKGYKTALEEAEAMIAAANKVSAGKAQGAGRTAGSVTRKPGALAD